MCGKGHEGEMVGQWEGDVRGRWCIEEVEGTLESECSSF